MNALDEAYGVVGLYAEYEYLLMEASGSSLHHYWDHWETY